MDRQELDVLPTFPGVLSLQITKDPTELRSLASLLPAITDRVMEVLSAITYVLGEHVPTDLELGHEHEAVAPEWGGDTYQLTTLDGTVHAGQFPGPGDGPENRPGDV